MTETENSTSPLAGITVLDLSRVLAGPWCTQMLGDLGAEVIKIEQPGEGDDTRKWGPPFLPDGSGDSGYYLCANRNKRSVAIDIARPEGQDLIRQLAAQADVLVENFAPGVIETQMTAQFPQEMVAAMVPMRRMGRPEEVAGIVAVHRRRLEEHGARHVAVAVLDNASGEGTDDATAADSPARSSLVRPSADFSTLARSARQTRAISCRISTKPGRPQREVGGKYVPPWNGSRSGVSQTLIGQPPDPVVAWTNVM